MNLAVVITAGMIENPLVVATVEKAVQTKKNIIYIEDLLVGTKGVAEITGLEDNIMKKLKDIPAIPYFAECSAECNDALLSVMKFAEPEPVHESMHHRKQAVLDDILRFSAKVSKMRIKAQVKRRNDFCLTAAPGPSGEKIVLALRDIFDKRAPALTVASNRGDKSTAASSVRVQNVQESFNLVVIVTKNALQDGDLLEEIRVALESEVQIVLVQFLEEVPDLKTQLDAMEDPVLQSNVSRIIPFPYLSGEGNSVVRALLVPSTVKVDDNKSPRTRAAGVPTFRLGYKNASAVDMPSDGRMPIYQTQKIDERALPTEIDDIIKELWAIYAPEDEKKTPVEQRKISWDQFVTVDRVVIETVGADYSEMVSRRIYSMMLYPGLTLEETVSFQTFRNYYDFTAKKMGCMNSDPDVRTHFRYVVDKVKFMQKSKRYQKKYDLFISHDRSKVAKAMCTSLMNAIRIATPNLRVCICTEKRIQQDP